MAQAVASMAGLRGATQAVLDGSRQLGGSSRLARPGSSQVKVGRRVGLRIQALAGDNDVAVGRRALVSLVAGGLAGGAFVEAVLAEAKSIKVGPPPAPSGGLPGTENSDQARDLVLPLKQRFYLQPLPPTEAALRAKESAKCIVSLKGLIDKKAWPYVQNDLRLKASYLRYDLNTVISAKPNEEKKALKELVAKLYATIDGLDHAAKIKSSSEAEKYYEATKTAIDNILVKLG